MGERTTEPVPPDLPQNWQVLPLGTAVNLSRGLSWGKADESPDGIPVIAIPNVKNGQVSFDIKYRINKKITAAKQLHKGDILLVGSSGGIQNVGRTAVVGELPFVVATFASFLVKAEPTPVITRDFLYYLLASDAVDFPSCCKRAADGKFNLQVRQLQELPVPLPPLPEQRAIAHVLRTVQQAKEATERVIAACRQLKQSLMRHLFTYGPVPFDQADQVELKETEIGAVPTQWDARLLGELVASGPQNGLYKPHSFYGTGTPILRIDDFPNEGGVVDTAHNRVRLSDEEIQKYGLAEDDIVVNRVNSLSHLGKMALVARLSEPMVFESNMMRFTVSPSTIPEYVFHFMTLPACREQLRGRAKRAVAQSSINQGDVKSVIVPCPPLPEQQEIIKTVAAVESKVRAEEGRRNAFDALFKSLLHNLMTGKVRVV